MSTVVKLFFAFAFRRVRRVAVVNFFAFRGEHTENNLTTATRRARRKAMKRILE
jgi:sirohydrochlorin ferrochelatase